MLNLFKYFNIFKKDNEVDDESDDVELNIPLSVKIDKLIANSVDKYSIDKLTYKGFDKNKPSILIVDDNEYVKDIYSYDFKKMNALTSEDILSKYNIIYALGEQCGLDALNYIVRDFNIKIALLDLTLTRLYHVEDDLFMELDGIDIAIALEKYLPNTVYRFLTAHNLNYPIGIIEEYLNKSTTYLNKELPDITINKSNRNKEAIYLELIREHENA